MLQKIGLAVAALVFGGGTAVADQRFSVQVYGRPRVTRVYRAPTYVYPPPRYYYTYRPGYYAAYPPGYYTTYRRAITVTIVIVTIGAVDV